MTEDKNKQYDDELNKLHNYFENVDPYNASHVQFKAMVARAFAFIFEQAKTLKDDGK